MDKDNKEMLKNDLGWEEKDKGKQRVGREDRESDREQTGGH